jgi:hypothetical protein
MWNVIQCDEMRDEEEIKEEQVNEYERTFETKESVIIDEI